MNLQGLTSRKWFYPLVYIALVVLSMWPPYAQIPYDPRNTQDVILSILKVSTQPYAAWGWVFHVATLGVIALAVFRSKVAGRVMATYFGLNYLIIAALQTHAVTEKYGLAVQTGALSPPFCWDCSGCGWPGRTSFKSRFGMSPPGAGFCSHWRCWSSGRRLRRGGAKSSPTSTHFCCSPRPTTD